MTDLNVVFMGSEKFSLPILRSLAQDDAHIGTRVGGIVTQPDRAGGRGRKVAGNPVKAFAVDHDIPALQPERLRDESSISEVLALKPDLIVVASYGQIVPRMLLDAPTHGSLNLHPSLLPLYRGASPITAPILAGDRETGVTLMLMRPKMDAGPILAQETVPIDPAETAGELEARLADISAHLLSRRLEPWVSGGIEPVEQDERFATYTTRLEKSDGRHFLGASSGSHCSAGAGLQPLAGRLHLLGWPLAENPAGACFARSEPSWRGQHCWTGAVHRRNR